MGLTIVDKSDLWTRKRDPRVALVLAGGAVTGGAYKLGGLKALDDFLVNRKTNDFDIYVGLSAGAFLAAPLAGGVTPVEMLRSIDGTSEDFTQLSALEFYRLNVSEFVRKPLEFVVDLATYVPGLLYGFISRTPELVSQLKEPLEQCRRQPSLGNMVECVKPLIDAIGSAREFPFPPPRPGRRRPRSPGSTSPPASRASTTSTGACVGPRTSTRPSSTVPTSSSATTRSARSRTAWRAATFPSGTSTRSRASRWRT